MKHKNTRNALFFAALLARLPAAGAMTFANEQLADLSLEELNNIVVTSVSRQEERLSNVAASIFIISGAEIQRSGARSLPEALRLAPNLQVAQLDARNYAISSRGFDGAFTNKLLVLVDGRSIYSPLFSGVFWDAQDVVLEDVERIEVISGPGATIWGANAVNGVINVITRSARDSKGALITAAAGGDSRDGSARYGAALPQGGALRAYARYAEADDTYAANGGNTFTGWRRRQAGFRADWEQQGITVSGDVYQGSLGQALTRDIAISGGNLVGRYLRKIDEGSDLRLQLVLDHTERNQPNAFVNRLDTFEFEAQHGLRLERHSIAWGGGYRESHDRSTAGPMLAFLPGHLNMHWGNLFAQDEYALAPKLRMTAGVRAEHNNYTGLEWLPSARLAWMPDASQLVWGSLSRTVRAPSRIDSDLYAPPQPVIVNGKPIYLIGGGPDFKSELARVAELGYRAQPSPQWSYSATVWYADYSRLRTLEPNPNARANEGLSVFRNMAEGRTRGVEAWARWQVMPHWRLQGGVVLQRVETNRMPGSADLSADTGLGSNDPNSRWQLRSSHDLPANMQLDWMLRRVGSLPHPQVPSYHELDAQWSWRATPFVELALIGRNLLHRSHAEFGALPGRSLLQRAGMLKMTLRF
jgi:iron complex outermembrane receptor protein